MIMKRLKYVFGRPRKDGTKLAYLCDGKKKLCVGVFDEKNMCYGEGVSEHLDRMLLNEPDIARMLASQIRLTYWFLNK